MGFAIERNLLVRECPIRNEAGLISDDDLFVRIGQYTNVVGISFPLVSVRLHSASVSASVDSLSRQLAEDYLFQVRYHNRNDSYLDAATIELYYKLATRFIEQFFVDALRSAKTQWIIRAIQIKSEFEQLVPLYTAERQSLIKRYLWKASRNNKLFPVILNAAKGRKLLAKGAKFFLRRAGYSKAK